MLEMRPLINEAEVLRLADTYVRSRPEHFTREAIFTARPSTIRDGLQCRIVSTPDGCRRVYLAPTGELLAASLPGRFLTPVSGAAVPAEPAGLWLARGVAQWLKRQAELDRFAEGHGGPEDAIDDICGWRGPSWPACEDGDEEPSFLVLPRALVACFAAVGVDCATAKGFASALSELDALDLDLIRPALDGPLPGYHVRGAILDTLREPA